MTLAPPPPLSSSSAVRLRLVAQPVQGHMPRRIDGAWWPRSPDLTSELPWLVVYQAEPASATAAAFAELRSRAARQAPGHNAASMPA